ncbi:MAG: hypothetical protein H6551_11095 [Chitinophagales bacterium]|nr:hypothetical protein [Chitinophagaceae bacterium]MCB9065671.1 hypothetical protein [Chitinophagales bacterium]
MNKYLPLLLLTILFSCKEKEPPPEINIPKDTTIAYEVSGVKDITLNNLPSSAWHYVEVDWQKGDQRDVILVTGGLPQYVSTDVDELKGNGSFVGSFTFTSLWALPGTYDAYVTAATPNDSVRKYPFKITVEQSSDKACHKFYADHASELKIPGRNTTYNTVIKYDDIKDELYVKNMCVLPSSPMGSMFYSDNGVDTGRLKVHMDCNTRVITIPEKRVYAIGNPPSAYFYVKGTGEIVPDLDSTKVIITMMCREEGSSSGIEYILEGSINLK